jgi:hypothetical protein
VREDVQASLSRAAEVFHFHEEQRREHKRMKVSSFVRSSIFLLLVPCFAPAGSNPKTAVAVRTPVPPTIDGVLDEPEWKLAKPITDFVQFLPNEGSKPTENTEVRILYDDHALYFGCTMFDSDPSKIVARLARRDDEVESDYIELLLDSYNDNQTDFEFHINASGTRVDLLGYDDGQEEDYSWDPVWEVKTRITEQGWVAEVRIPFKMLRYSDQSGTEWGLEIIRKISRKKEQTDWVLIRASDNGWAHRFRAPAVYCGSRTPSVLRRERQVQARIAGHSSRERLLRQRRIRLEVPSLGTVHGGCDLQSGLRAG